jgi:predicted DNA-binding transcriptional regulator AlpA
MTPGTPDVYLDMLTDAIADKVAARLADYLASAVADEVAARLADRLAATTRVVAGHARLVSAGELAEILAVSRATIYEHAEELGAVRVGGDGPRSRHGGPRLRFDVQKALERWSSRQTGRESHQPEPPAGAGRTPRRRQRAPGSGVELLPVGGRKAP